MARGLTPKLPIVLDEVDGIKLVKNFPDLVEQNLKNLILTMPGERVMDPLFGVGISKFLFEQNVATTYVEIRAKINQQVNKYMPFVRIDDIVFTNEAIESQDGFLARSGTNQDPNFVGVRIVYTIVPLKATRNLKL
tara:strand:+ start:160 stop:567 length:408 start_codon:yes stop_codon:yes gene_type:complete